jgi:hypothetical protein
MTHRLRITEFEAGMNIYTGTMQGGHAYATITDPDGERHELEYEIDRAFISALKEQYRYDEERLEDALAGYKIGQPTTRLRGKEHAIELAVLWMQGNAPDGTLVSEYYDDEAFYPERTAP